MRQKVIVIISTIHGDDGAGWKRDFSSDCYVMLLPIGNIGVGREIAIMIEEKV